MGEGKIKSRSRKAVIAAEPRCIYCAAPATTSEHMPPIGMFRGRQRPSGLEFGTCSSCNNGTRGADAVAALFARVHPDMPEDGWKAKEFRGLISAIDAHAPGVRRELSLPGKQKEEWARRAGSGVLQKVVRVDADGPLVAAYLGAFGAKLAMALFRYHVGIALPEDGAVWCQFSFYGGMTPKMLDERVQILPIGATLNQGSKTVGDQFAYRYNCDDRTTFAAVVQFHNSLWFTLFASSDQKIIDLFQKPLFRDLPASIFARPGDLLGMIPAVSPARLYQPFPPLAGA